MIGTKIREFRTSKKISLDKLGAMTGLTGAYIGRLERNEQDHLNPTIGTLQKIAVALEISVSDLISDSSEAINE